MRAYLCFGLALADDTTIGLALADNTTIGLADGYTTITVSLPTNPTAVNPLIMGCHSDSGFAVEPFGFESQMVVGESFETWTPAGSGTPPANISWNQKTDGVAAFDFDIDDPFHGRASQKISLQTGSFAAVTNRGLNNEGLVFEAGKPYTGYIFARAVQPTTLIVALNDHKKAKALARVELTVAGDEWVKYNFTLTPSDSTTCEFIPFGSDQSITCYQLPTVGHSCQSCGGEFSLGLAKAGDTVNLDFAALHPGEWGRFEGLEIRRDAVEMLKSMGVTAIRQGGSFTDPDYYFWKKWRGPKWERQSFGDSWRCSYESSWGPFDFVDMCNAAGIEPIVTTAADAGPTGKAKYNATCCNASDMADLVEYCWGDPYTTEWGRVRAADGHPQPYRLKYIELGNEQYNHNFVDQVTAMEKRATELGMPKTLYYLFPDNVYLNDNDLAQAEKLGLGDHMIIDLHVGATGSVGMADKFFNSTASTAGAMNCEVNAGIHTMQRALTEAIDLNLFFNVDANATSGKLKGRMASFCMERSGHTCSHWDQGLSFFDADKVWLQPPGFVHKMVYDAWQPNKADVKVTSSLGCFAALPACPARTGQASICCHDSASAASSADGNSLSVRYVNPTNTTVHVSVKLPDAKMAGSSWQPIDITLMNSLDLNDANPANDTLHISPQTSPLQGASFDAPPQSFAVLRFSKA